MDWLITEAGVDINQCDNYNMTALFSFAMNSYLTQNDIESLKWLVSRGIDLNHLDSIDWTALHWAANSNNLDAMRFFIEECHMNPACNFGSGTPADVADGNDEVLTYLRTIQDNEYL